MTLYVVPTPIGNIGDITVRALDVLKKVDVILSEDSRVTRKLFDLLVIDSSGKRFIPFHDHNEIHKVDEVVEILRSGADVALVSDAGTPLISDPGYKLVSVIADGKKGYADIDLVVLPGATSVTTALAASGFPPDKFMFLGYFPRKDSQRHKMLDLVKMNNERIKSTFIFFESPYRIMNTLKVINDVYSDQVEICLCWELTKKFERVMRGSADFLLKGLSGVDKHVLKGELVVLLSFKKDKI